MRITLMLILAGLLVSCSTTKFERKQQNVLDCVKEMRDSDVDVEKGLEVCRQVYRLKKID